MDLPFLVHDGTFRGSPGSGASTRRALSSLRLPPRPVMMDLGSGIGDATLELLKATDGKVLAVDLHEPFLQRLAARAQEHGLQHRLTPLRASLQNLPFTDEMGPVFDLIWAEGSLYLLGVERSLSILTPMLPTSGYLVATELVWTVPEDRRPKAAVDFWGEAYPDMGDSTVLRQRFRKSGYHVVADFMLPDADWNNYYNPLEQRIQRVQKVLADAGAQPEAVAAIAQMKVEIELRRAHADSYGYCCVVGEKMASTQ